MRRLLLLLLVLAGAAHAQSLPATLIADAVRVEGDSTLVADGSVEVLYEGRRLRAARVTYDRRTDRLAIAGPITLQDGPDTLVLASAAELSSDFRDGVLTSARLVLGQQLQLAANEITRVGGRYTELTRTVASSCEVCAAHPRPLWEIRAARVVHDQAAGQLYFDRAQFRVAGVPVFYLPRLRLPDPSNTRARGVLLPSIRSTSRLGFGLKVPYFLPLGPSRDLTLTPYLAGSTRTGEVRYREAFRRGRLEFTGALSDDDLGFGGTRGYLFGGGSFGLPNDFIGLVRIETVTDPAYLLDYGYSDRDRLQSGVGITRTQRDAYVLAEVLAFHSLRAGEDNNTLPSRLADASIVRRFDPGVFGGTASLEVSAASLQRTSTRDGLGRDSARLTSAADWRRTWILRGGVTATALARLTADGYAITEDSTYPASQTRITPALAAEVRWPLVRRRGTASETLEPVVQVAYAPDTDRRVPNEDSSIVSLDEGNLFALDRFPGADRLERGLRTSLGLGYTRIAASGTSFGVTGGRVFRARDLDQFSFASALAGTRSDWVTALTLATPAGLSLENRALFDDRLDFTSEELRLAVAPGRFGLVTGYTWLRADPAEDRLADTSEWVFDGSVQITPSWSASAGWRYDFTTSNATRAAVGLGYRTECISIEARLSRRYTSSADVAPSTDFGLAVDLIGFGSGTAGPAVRRRCVG